MPGRRTLGKLCSIRRGNNSSAHVNQEFRTPLILRALRCGILGPAVQPRRSGKLLSPPCTPGLASIRAYVRGQSPPLSTFCWDFPRPLPSAPELGLLPLHASHRRWVGVFLTCTAALFLRRQRLLTGPDGPTDYRPGFFYASSPPPTSLPRRHRHTNGPRGSLRAGLLLDRAVSGNRQISICRALWHGCPSGRNLRTLT